ncbi:MAG: hypothetical protein M0Z50_16525 [Planctomycetia bacterium]|nr:hypothetical protein [Planctomycetia bacterium]
MMTIKKALVLSVLAALLPASNLAFAGLQSVGYTVPSGSISTVQPSQSAVNQAVADGSASAQALYQAGQSYVSSNEQTNTGNTLANISSGTTTAGNTLPPAIQTWYSQYEANTLSASYWYGQIWTPYSYGCGTTASPATCTKYLYDSVAASDYSYYLGLANKDYYNYTQDRIQHGIMNDVAANQSTASGQAITSGNQLMSQAKSQQAQSQALENAGNAVLGQANNGMNNANVQAGINGSVTSIQQINAETNGALSPAMVGQVPNPVNEFAGKTDGINGRSIASSAPGMQQMTNLENADQNAMTDQANQYVIQQKSQAAQTQDQVQANALQQKADMSPTPESYAAWSMAAQNAQNNANTQAANAQAAINQQNADQAAEQTDTAQASALAGSASTSAGNAAIQQGDAWDAQELQKIQQQTGVSMQEAQ